jgi:putative transposase
MEINIPFRRIFIPKIKSAFYLADLRINEHKILTIVVQCIWAMALKHPAKGLLLHSDRGVQYCSHEFREILELLGVKVSMSGKENCYDNAPMESFWGTLKQELVHHRHYRTRREAIRDITEYIGVFYNRQRIQASLGFVAPAVFARKYYSVLLAA